LIDETQLSTGVLSELDKVLLQLVGAIEAIPASYGQR